VVPAASARRGPAKGHQVTASGCKRIAGEPKNISPANAPTTTERDQSLQREPAVGTDVNGLRPSSNHGLTWRDVHLLGPPPDLIILLQHITI
jgi:hypothetical protein